MNDSYRSIIKDSRLHFPPRPKVSLVLFRASCRETPLPVALQNALHSLVQHRIIIIRFYPQDSSKFQRSTSILEPIFNQGHTSDAVWRPRSKGVSHHRMLIACTWPLYSDVAWWALTNPPQTLHHVTQATCKILLCRPPDRQYNVGKTAEDASPCVFSCNMS